MNHTEQDIWLRQFEQENVQVVVLSAGEDGALVKTLRHRTDWSIDFEGDGAVIFVRSAQKGKN